MARPRQVSDEEIDRAARETFLKHGPNAPVSRIAKTLQVSQAALFHRARSKAELMLRALKPAVPDAAEALENGPRMRGLHRQLAPILASLLKHLEQVSPALAILRTANLPLHSARSAAEPPTVMLRRMLSGWLTRAHQSGQTQIRNPAVIAEALLGALEARAFNRYLGGPAFTPGSDRSFIRHLIEGLVPETGPR